MSVPAVVDVCFLQSGHSWIKAMSSAPIPGHRRGTKNKAIGLAHFCEVVNADFLIGDLLQELKAVSGEKRSSRRLQI